MRKLVTAAVATAAALCACGPRLIPGTNIEDTDDNEAVVNVVNQYRAAYNAKDADAILKLVSPRFYETNGTADPSDDYDYNGLSKTLHQQFESIVSPALDVDIRKVIVKDDQAVVDYYFASRFQLADAGPNGGFKTASDVAEIKLHREDGSWKITSGI